MNCVTNQITSGQPRRRRSFCHRISWWRLSCAVVVAFLPVLPLHGIAQHLNSLSDSARVVAILESGEPGPVPVIDSATTLDDYLRIAVLRNPGVRAAYNRWIAEVQQSGYTGALPDPMFMYGYMFEHFDPGDGPMEQRFGVQQSLPVFGTLGAMKDMSKHMSRVSYKRFEAALRQLQYDVTSAFYQYYFLGQDLRITRENLELLTFWETVAQTKYKVGLKQHPDMIKAQVELGILEDRVYALEEQSAPLGARLVALLNLPASTKLPLPQAIALDEVALHGDSVVAAVRRYNPDLNALQSMIAREQAAERLARRMTYPELSLGVDYAKKNGAPDLHTGQAMKDTWMISAGVSLPIWFGKNKARRSEAAARRRAAEYELRDAENDLIVFAREALFEYADALRKTRLYRDGLVPKAQQSLYAAYTAYQAGETDFLNVLDAQRQLLEFQLTAERAKVSLGIRRAQLEMLSGTELDNFVIHETN